MNSIDHIVRFIDLARVTVPLDEFTAQERAALDNVNHRVASGESLADVMDFVFESTLDLFPCDRLSISFVQEDDRVVSHWTRALYDPLILQPGYAEDLRQSTLARVRDTGHVRIIDDLKAYLEAKPHSASTRLLVREGVFQHDLPAFGRGAQCRLSLPERANARRVWNARSPASQRSG